MVGRGCRRRDGGGTHAGFVGENPSGHAVPQGGKDRGCQITAEGAAHRPGTERHLKDHKQTGRQIRQIADDHQKPADHIKHRHNRHHQRRYPGNTADTSHDHHKRKHCENDSHHLRRETKSRMQRCGYRIALCHIANAKGSKHGKKCKAAAESRPEPRAARQPVPRGFTASSASLAQGVSPRTLLPSGTSRSPRILHGIHGSAAHFSPLIFLPVLHRQHTFCEFGRKTKKGGNPHPHQCSRSAGRHGCGDAHDISRADSCRQSRHQSRERRHIAVPPSLLPGLSAECHPDSPGQIPPRKKTAAYRQHHAGSHQQHKHDRSPYRTIHRCNHFRQIIHGHSSFRLTGVLYSIV